MAVGGMGSWVKAGSKPLVTAATVLGVLYALPVLA